MKTLEIRNLTEHINEVLRMIEEGETIEVRDGNEVIAHLVPAAKSQQLTQQERSAVWTNLERLAAEIGAHWKDNVSAVDAVRDVRREL